MRISSKNSNNQSVTITFEGGLNLSAPSTNIADNELQECLNLYYANLEKYLTTRMGIKVIDVPVLNSKIEKLYEFIKDESTTYLIAASEGKIYYLKSTVTNNVETLSWEKITDLTNSTILPSFITYSGKLVFADRGSNLRYWDGTTTASISSSPPYVTIIEQIQGRIVCNSEASGELDAIYFSAPYDMENWDTNNGAVGLRAGYGEGKRVVGLGIIANDLIIFKEGGITYRINCSGTTSSWNIQKLFDNNTCTSQESIETVGNDLVFGSLTGLNSVMTVKEYGDIKVNLLGHKTSSLLNGKTIRESSWSSLYGVLFLMIEGTNTILVFHPHLSSYTTFDFGIRVNSICSGKYNTYLGDNSGKLYKMNNLSHDELELGTTLNIHSRLKTKTYTFPDEILIKKSRIFLEQIDYTQGYYSVFDRSDTNETILYNWLPNYAGYLYDANYELYDASMFIYGDALSYFDTLSQFRDQAVSFALDLELGRAKIKSISLSFSLVST